MLGQRSPCLKKNRSEGGLGLPNFLGYYSAANTQKILLWLVAPQLSWCQLEAGSCFSSLQSLACSTHPPSLSSSSCNPIVINTLHIWFQIRSKLGKLTLAKATPICNNHLLLPAKTDSRFRYFESQGLQCLGDLYIDGLFATFQQLYSKFDFHSSNFFRFLQLRDFTRTRTPHFPRTPPSSGIDLVLHAKKLPKGHIFFL